MTALWESSTRSLFVKTVWKDGHRHVLLQEEAVKNTQKSPTESTKPRTTSSKPANSPKPFAQHLRVPSVKLRLKKFMGLRIDSVKRSLKGKKHSKKKKREVVLDDQEENEKLEGEAEELRLQSQHNENKYRKITKSFTIDVEDASRNSILANNYPIGTKLLQSDDNFTSLSDRVLMWLDLATQNGSCSQSMANFKRISFAKPRLTTAGLFPSNRTFNNCEKSRISLQRQCRFDIDDEDSFTSDLDDDCYSSDDSILKCNAINLEKGKLGLNEVSVSKEDDEISENAKHCCVNDKRQLHIFMPNLPQIMLEVDEVSVSKCSSIVQLDET